MTTVFLNTKKVRLHFLWSLIFSFLLIACTDSKKENNSITIQWNGEKAVGVDIPRSLLKKTNEDSILKLLRVCFTLINTPNDVLGEYTINKETVSFKPHIAFTPGFIYEVFFANTPIDTFQIPSLLAASATEVLFIHPSADTLPENTLKLYISFSRPMQEGNALKNITVIRNNTDSLSSTFLDLDQELWNKDRTVLTLWFDPGRVKRDMQPNKTLGTPLQKNNSYKIIINKVWRDERGLALKADYHKDFVTVGRDITSPNPENWTLNKINVLSNDPLLIHLHEPLDFILLKNTLRIINDDGYTLEGDFEPLSKETILKFTPADNWKPGEYEIIVESRLEDLAGNNLNRLFDKDLSKPDTNRPKETYTKKFRVD